MIDLSLDAEQDLEDIFDYTVEHHGAQQALHYVSSFERSFQELDSNPLLGRDRSEIRPTLRSLNHEHHVIFYRVLLGDVIRVLRILHGSRDLPRQFG